MNKSLILVCSVALLITPLGVTATPWSATQINSMSMASTLSSAPRHFAPDRENNNTDSLKVSSAQQATQLVQSRFQGKVLKVQSSKVNGHPGYRVKLLANDGVVFYVLVDAQTGSVSRN